MDTDAKRHVAITFAIDDDPVGLFEDVGVAAGNREGQHHGISWLHLDPVDGRLLGDASET